MLRCLFVAVLLIVPSGSLSAQTVRLEQYQNASDPKFRTFNHLYLKGVVDGFIAYSIADTKNRFFCIPPKLAVTVEQAEEIMLRYADKKQLPGTVPIGVPLFGGLREAFPCGQE